MIKGENYASQLYENWSNRLVFDTLLGGKCGIVEGFDNNLVVTSAGSNVSIDSGVVVVKGGIIRNTTLLTLPVQLEANQYCIVVVEVDLSKVNTENDFLQGSIKVISQTGSYPDLTQQDIVNNTTSGIYQFELARFTTSTTAIQNLTDRRTYLSYESLYREVQNAIDRILQENLVASDIGYDNQTSGLESVNVQDAIDELKNGLDNINIGGSFSVTSTSVTHTIGAGGSVTTKTGTLTNNGYYPLGIVGIDKTEFSLERYFVSDKANGTCKVSYKLINPDARKCKNRNSNFLCVMG